MSFIVICPMFIVGIVVPSHPFVLSTKLLGCVNVVGINIYPYPDPTVIFAYVLTA